MRVLMVAEKPSIAEAIATNLCTSSSGPSKRQGIAVPVYEFDGKFQGQNCTFLVSSTTGHVFSLDFHSRYNDWNRVQPLELFSAETAMEPAGRASIIPHLRQLAGGCSKLVLWLDCDREGENICFEVIGLLRGGGWKVADNDIYRAKFSALTKQEMTTAMMGANLARPDKNISDAVDVRQLLDLRYGVAFTRCMTMSMNQRFGDLDSSCLSIGPVITPAAMFCVNRHEEIAHFKPETFFTIQPTLSGGRGARWQWQRGRVFDEPMARLLHAKVTAEGKTATVYDVKSSNETRPRPVGLRTVEMLKVMSRMGLGAGQTMHAAESLYMQGYLSYPRTESTAYPASFDFKSVVRELEKSPQWGKYAAELQINRAKAGNDAGDHPPITPMRAATMNELGGGDVWKLYEYVCRHFLASISPDARLRKTMISVELHGERFSATGRVLEDEGWLRIMPHLAQNDEALPVSLQNLEAGSALQFSDVQLAESRTSPPGYLSEADLIELMDKHGVGTDASIPQHVENLAKKNFVEDPSVNQRRMIPSKLGILLCRSIRQIDPELVTPKVRGEVEKMLTLIAEGKVRKDVALSHAIELFRKKFIWFSQVANLEKISSLLSTAYAPLTETGQPFTRCGVCTRYMRLITTKPQRLYCPKCETQLMLPNTGTIKKYFEKRCPIDDFELVVLHIDSGQSGASKVLNPSCYNNPPFTDYAKQGMTCDMCLHPTCAESLRNTYICDCIDDHCRGAMAFVLRSSGQWKVVCNLCPMLIALPREAKRVKVLPTECPECGAKEMEWTFASAENSPLPGRPLVVSGCLFCTPLMMHAVQHVKGRFAQRGGRGRGGEGGRGRSGRGRGGRGRGRGDYSERNDKAAKMSFSW